MAKRMTISAPVGTLNTLATLDGWRSEGGGVFVVTCEDWRDDVARAFGATVVSEEDIDDDDE